MEEGEVPLDSQSYGSPLILLRQGAGGTSTPRGGTSSLTMPKVPFLDVQRGQAGIFHGALAKQKRNSYGTWQ